MDTKYSPARIALTEDCTGAPMIAVCFHSPNGKYEAILISKAHGVTGMGDYHTPAALATHYAELAEFANMTQGAPND